MQKSSAEKEVGTAGVEGSGKTISGMMRSRNGTAGQRKQAVCLSGDRVFLNGSKAG